MIRDAAYEGLAYRLRTKLHAAAGRAVEKLSTDLDADADTLSLHFWRGGDPASTWKYARMAGDRAARAYANTDAAAQYERALDAARALPGVTDAQRLELWRRLGEVRDLAGLYESAIDAFGKALRLARDNRAAANDLVLKRAHARLRVGASSSALGELTKAERALAGDTSLDARRERVRIRSMRAIVRQAQERLADTLTEAQGIVDEARATGEYEALESALIAIDVAAFQLGDTTVGANTLEALELARAHGRLKRAWSALTNLGAFAFYTGRWDTAVDRYVEGRSAALELGDVVGAAYVGLNLGELYVNRGQLDQADEVLEDAVRVLRVAGSHTDAAYGVLQQARAHLDRGDVELAERMAEDVEIELVTLAQRVSALEATLVRAEALTRQARPADALAVIEASSESAKGEGVALLPRVHRERARALLALGRADEAALEAFRGLDVAREHSLAYEEAMLLDVQAAIADETGDHELTERSSADSTRILEGLGVRIADRSPKS
jgi:tetratricopeptide (TPR) repeat protein